MQTGQRRRTVCQACHTAGRYRPFFVSAHLHGLARTAQVVFCDPCRTAWMDMTFGVERFRPPRTPFVEDLVADPANGDELESPEARTRRRFKQKRDLYRTGA